MGQEPEQCVYCKFWRSKYLSNATVARLAEIENDGDYEDTAGYCQRYPPVLGRGNYRGGFDFPATLIDDWCGEFKRTELQLAVSSDNPDQGRIVNVGVQETGQ